METETGKELPESVGCKVLFGGNVIRYEMNDTFLCNVEPEI